MLKIKQVIVVLQYKFVTGIFIDFDCSWNQIST